MVLSCMLLLAQSFALPQAEFARYYESITGTKPAADLVTFAVDAGLSKEGHDAYAITSTQNGARIVGSNERSLLYGVYDLLERRGGCGWFWDGDVVPKRAAVDLKGLSVREESRFAYRGLRYFAHRGLTRFQAEHWGWEDWKREIDWMVKKRLNLFMLRIGQDDLFQKAFPQACAYPDPSKPLPGALDRYDNRSLFWSLEYRGELRKKVMDYAKARGLMSPEDFGTMTHWYSRTPLDFIENMNPEFFPMPAGAYGEPSGMVWDIRKPEWLDAYFRLTDAAVAEYGSPALLHTIGVAEREVSTNRAENLRVKAELTNLIIDTARRRYPGTPIVLAGWDLYNMKTPAAARAFLRNIPEDVVIWDYEADASINTNFTEWDIVGKRPYVFGVFMAYEAGLDPRTDYAKIAARQKAIAGDPMCRGFILWPESSHVDAMGIEWFARNAWRGEAPDLGETVRNYCARRYGTSAAAMADVWMKTVPVSTNMQNTWRWNAYLPVMREMAENVVEPEQRDRWPAPKPDGVFRDAASVCDALAALGWDSNPMLQRDMTDLARVWADRLAVECENRAFGAYFRWTDGEAAAGAEFGRWADRAEEYLRILCDILHQHTDYSMCDTLDRLRAEHPVPNPDFGRVLMDNVVNYYCASHQAEMAEHCYIPAFRAYCDHVKDRIARNDRTPPDGNVAKAFRVKVMEKPLEAYRSAAVRSRANFNRALGRLRAAALRDFAVKNLLNPDPSAWTRLVPADITVTGGVVRISQKSADYRRSFGQEVEIDGAKTYCLTAKMKCDALTWRARIDCRLRDADGKQLESYGLLRNFCGPQEGWFDLSFPIPARAPLRGRRLYVHFDVYNDSRQPGEDRAIYFKDIALTEYAGEAEKCPPRIGRGRDVDTPFPAGGYASKTHPYLLERGGVGFFEYNARTCNAHGRDGLKITGNAPDGVELEFHRRCVLIRADDAAPAEFTVRLDAEVGKVRSSAEIPVRLLPAPQPVAMPASCCWQSWIEEPLDRMDADERGRPLARALEAYWRSLGWRPNGFVHIGNAVPFRMTADPMARAAVDMNGAALDAPCDTALLEHDVSYYAGRLRKYGDLGRKLPAARACEWDWEPYTTGPVSMYCWCGDCRRAFEKAYGVSAALPLKDVVGSHLAKWVSFRCRQRAAYVGRVAEAIKSVNPSVELTFCTLPYAPDAKNERDYLEKWGVDLRLLAPHADAIASMNYGPTMDVFRSMEREVRELGKPIRTIVDNGWPGYDRVPPARFAMHLKAAYFLGMDKPFAGPGFKWAQGDFCATVRSVMAWVAEGELSWGRAPLAPDRTVVEAQDVYSVDRRAADGRRFVLLANNDPKGPRKVRVGGRTVTLGPYGVEVVEQVEGCRLEVEQRKKL